LAFYSSNANVFEAFGALTVLRGLCPPKSSLSSVSYPPLESIGIASVIDFFFLSYLIGLYLSLFFAYSSSSSLISYYIST